MSFEAAPPPPGTGYTLERWRSLAAHALSLAKLYKAHTDAMAILYELDQPLPPGWAWGVWAAEPPQARLSFERASGTAAVVGGRKAWYAGAGVVDHVLVTAWQGDAGPYLIAIDLRQHGIQYDGTGWRAIGMAESASLDVLLDRVPACIVGAVGEYLRRPGF